MRFGFMLARVTSASDGLLASPITCSVGQLSIRRRSPARTTTSSSTSNTRVRVAGIGINLPYFCWLFIGVNLNDDTVHGSSSPQVREKTCATAISVPSLQIGSALENEG